MELKLHAFLSLAAKQVFCHLFLPHIFT